MRPRLRIYSVAEANAMLPQLSATIAGLREHVRVIESTVARWHARLDGATPDLRPRSEDSPEIARVKVELRARIAQFRREWDALDGTGAVLKDVREGLVDFYGRRGGELVWLCWRAGEPTVAHWHPLGQGFAARQPLDERVVAGTLN